MPVVPLSIDPTGRTDVSEQLNNWFKSLPAKTDAALPAGALYRVDSGVTLDEKQDLIINTPTVYPASFFSTTDKRIADKCLLDVVGGVNITINNLQVDGMYDKAGDSSSAYDETKSANHNIAARGVNGLTLNNVHSVRSEADLFYMGRLKVGPSSGGASSYLWNKNVKINGGQYVWGGRQAFTPSAVDSFTVDGATVGLVPRHFMDIEPNLSAFNGARNVFIKTTRVLNCHLGFVSLSGCGPIDNIILYRVKTDTPLDVWAQEGKDSPPNGPRRSGFYMIECESGVYSGNPLGATSRFDKWDGITMIKNVQPSDVLRKMALVAMSMNCTKYDIRENVSDAQYRIVSSLP